MRRCLFCFAVNSPEATACHRCGWLLDSAPAMLYARQDAKHADWSALHKALSTYDIRNISLSPTPDAAAIELLLGKTADLDRLVRYVSSYLPEPHTILFLADPLKAPLRAQEQINRRGIAALANSITKQWVEFPRTLGEHVRKQGTFMNRGGQIIRGVRDHEIIEKLSVPMRGANVMLRGASRDLAAGNVALAEGTLSGGTNLFQGFDAESPAVFADQSDRMIEIVTRSARDNGTAVPAGYNQNGGFPPTENRYLEARFPRRVRLGGSSSLEARIAVNAPSPDAFASLLDPLKIPDKGLMVKLSVHSSQGFRVTPSLHEVEIRRGADSKWVQFTVEALQPGAHQLEIVVYVDGVQAGALKIESEIHALAATTEPQVMTQDMTFSPRPPGDATLEITYDSTANAYHYKWIPFDGWFGSDDITHPLKAVPKVRIDKLLSTINDIARQRLSLSRTVAETLLKGEAIQLWHELIPKQLEDELLSRWSTTKRLMLRTRNDAIPWELLRPDADTGFLAEQFVVSRWSSSRELRKVIDMTRGEAVVPPKSPARATQEVSEITTILQPKTSLAKPIDSLEVLVSRLNKAEFQLLHFACHHGYSSGSGIKFNDALFTPAFLNINHFSNPLVFINACRADHKEATFTGVASWADKFIECGAAAFVGTLWDVRDEPAREFAKAFYTLIAGGTTLGEAVLQARAKIRDPSDPTWLAYTLYADPGAVVRR